MAHKVLKEKSALEAKVRELEAENERLRRHALTARDAERLLNLSHLPASLVVVLRRIVEGTG